MPYFKEGEKGSLIPLAPGQGLTLRDGVGGRATFFVNPHPCFDGVATVVITGERVGVTLQKTGDLPPDGIEHNVGRQGVTITHEPTGEEIKLVYVKDY